MRVVLHEAIKGVGNRGDVVEVSDGYGRNYLIPQGKGHRATAGAEVQAEAMRRTWTQKNAKDRAAAEEIAKDVVSKTLTIEARAGGDGKLFGSVTAADVADILQQQTGVEIDRKLIEIAEPIKTTGTHTVTAHPHPEVVFPLTVEVSAS